MKFDNRLLQYNPCPTNQQQNPGCGNSFHNAGSVTSKGGGTGRAVEAGRSWLNWYNSASYNKSTYDEDSNWCTTTCVIKATAGKQQVDTPKEMLASVLTLKHDGFSASLQGKYTGRRYYTYTNDQSFGGYTTFDLGMGYHFGAVGPLKGAKLSLNVTNLTNKRYASNFDSSVFARTTRPAISWSSTPRRRARSSPPSASTSKRMRAALIPLLWLFPALAGAGEPLTRPHLDQTTGAHGVSLHGQIFVNEGLVGAGRLPADTRRFPRRHARLVFLAADRARQLEARRRPLRRASSGPCPTGGATTPTANLFFDYPARLHRLPHPLLAQRRPARPHARWRARAERLSRPAVHRRRSAARAR